jgi:predicted ABC-type ATPase
LRVQYESGLTRRLDTAVRQNVLGATRQVNQKVQFEVGEEFGADGIEISAHSSPAPDHAPYQGKQMTKEAFEKLQGALDRPIGEWNCAHFVKSIILGVSKPTYSNEQLDQIRRDNEAGCVIDGKHYTTYEATQIQRKLETAVRYQKDIAIAAKNSGDDYLRAISQQNINELSRKYKQVSNTAGLPVKSERAAVSGYRPMGSKQMDKALNPESKIKDYGKTSTTDAVHGDSLSKWTTKSGELDAERERLHKTILNDIFKDATPTEDQPVFTMLGGGSGAGKSTVIKKGYASLPKNNVTVDSDYIKTHLPEYQKMVLSRNSNAANYVHEESSALAKRALSIGNKERYNITLDGTGDGSVKSVLKKIDAARAAGARVEGIYVTVPTDVAVERALARGAKTGRIVRPDVVTGTHQKVSEILPQVADKFDSVKLFDTTNEIVLIAEGGAGKPLTAIKGQEKLFQAFLDKAKA